MITSPNSNYINQSHISAINGKYKSMYQYTQCQQQQTQNQHDFIQLDPYLQQKQFICKWFQLSRQQRRLYNWQKIYLYKMLIPIFYPDIHLDQLLIPQNELNDKFNKFFSSAFRSKIIINSQRKQNIDARSISVRTSQINNYMNTSFSAPNGQQQIYNINEAFIFNLDKSIKVHQICKKNTRIQQKNRKFIPIIQQCRINPWKIVCTRQQNTQYIKIQTDSTPETKIIYTDRNLIQRYRTQLLKQDSELKNSVINNFVFCGVMPSINLNFQFRNTVESLGFGACWRVGVESFCRGQVVRFVDQRLYVLLEGSVLEEVKIKQKQRVLRQTLTQKWKFQLGRGSLLCRGQLKKVLKSIGVTTNRSTPQRTKKAQKIPQSQKYTQKIQEYSYSYIYTCQSDTKFLSISYEYLTKILKTQKNIRKNLLQKINQIQQSHKCIIQKSNHAQCIIKQSQTQQIQIKYSIPHNMNTDGRKSKIFRRRTLLQQKDYGQFLTYDRYEKITQNKQNVSKKHLIYSQLNNLLRDRQKQQRFIKKMHTEKGMKQIKKCQYQARQKQNKIQHLAIKDSIVNTQKYRNRPHQIKFIFEQQIMEKYMKNQNNNNRDKQNQNSVYTSLRRPKKYISMAMDINDDRSSRLCETRTCKLQQRQSVDEELNTRKFLKFNPDTKFSSKAHKFGGCQSSPNIQYISASKKKLRVGSAANIVFKKEQNRWV